MADEPRSLPLAPPTSSATSRGAVQTPLSNADFRKVSLAPVTLACGCEAVRLRLAAPSCCPRRGRGVQQCARVCCCCLRRVATFIESAQTLQRLAVWINLPARRATRSRSVQKPNRPQQTIGKATAASRTATVQRNGETTPTLTTKVRFHSRATVFS